MPKVNADSLRRGAFAPMYDTGQKWDRRCSNGHEEVKWYGTRECWFCGALAPETSIEKAHRIRQEIVAEGGDPDAPDSRLRKGLAGGVL